MREPSKRYYSKLVESMIAARLALQLPEEPNGRSTAWHDLFAARHGRTIDRKPLTDDEKRRLRLVPTAPLADQLTALSMRDAQLADAWQKQEQARLNEIVQKNQALRTKTNLSLTIKLETLDVALRLSQNEFEQKLAGRPSHTKLTAFLAWFGPVSDWLGLNGREQEIKTFDLAARRWKKTASEKRELIEDQKSSAESDAQLKINQAGWEMRDADTALIKLPGIVKRWTEEGQEFSRKWMAKAVAVDHDGRYEQVRAKLDKGEFVTEGEWRFYAGASDVVAHIAGFEALRAEGPGHKKGIALQLDYRKQFQDLILRQTPDYIWRLDLARKRLEDATTTSPAGRGSRERSIHDDWLSAAEIEKEIRERVEREEKERREKEQKEGKRSQQEQDHQRFLWLNNLLIEEMNRFSAKREAEQEIEAKRQDRSRGRSRGMSM